MLGVVKITQLAEPEACLVWWADVHRQTIALDEALISAKKVLVNFFNRKKYRLASFCRHFNSKVNNNFPLIKNLLIIEITSTMFNLMPA